ncbi:MAG: glycosyltransferase family 2 protein [Chryseobacterium sp.]|nr:MAG: glycosyltransferase family 2 protein [Chryseobacterium sp.]
MSKDPLISLIIPCYNAQQTLEKCLNSVIEQSYKNLEIIIVDDGSTDETSTIYEHYQKQDPRIKVFKQNNSGVSKARNKGVSEVTGELLCFVDSDDWVETNYCAELYDLLIKENADIAIVEASYDDLDGKEIFHKPITEEKVFDGRRALDLLLEDQVIQSHPWGKLYKAPFFKNIRFPEDLKSFEDYSTLFKVFDKAVKVAKSNKKLYHYVQHDDSLSHNLSPKTAYYFYLAIMEVFKFWQSTTPSQNQSKITRNIIRKLLMVLKRILRNTDKDEMQTEKEQIRQSFKSFLIYPLNEIGVEYYFYVRLYYYYPALYTKLIAKK